MPFLFNTLNSRINIRATRTVSNIVQKNRKCAPEAKRRADNYSEGFVLRNIQFSSSLYIKLNSKINLKSNGSEKIPELLLLWTARGLGRFENQKI